MRLVYVVSQYPNLTETFVAREMEQMLQMGHEVIICPLRPPAKPSEARGLGVSGPWVLRCPLTPWALLSALTWLLGTNPGIWLSCWRDIFDDMAKLSRVHHLVYILLVTTWLGRHLAGSGVDHIRGHFLHSEAISCRWLSRIIKKSYSLTAHTNIVLYPKSFIAKVVNGAAFVAGTSQHECNFLKGIRKQDVHLIYYGIDLNDFLMKNPHLGRQPPIILAVGSLFEKKGFDVLINACALLKRRGLIFTCRIIGKGRERPRLEELVRDLGLEDLVHMPGARPFQEVKQEFTEATIFVMPSKTTSTDQDGLPTVLFESMALGTPVVATRLAGIPDLVRDGKTGLLAEPDDPVSLADCISTLLKDRTLRAKFSETGRQLVESKCDIRVAAVNLSYLMQKALYD